MNSVSMIVCMRVEDCADPVAGSTKGTCCRCGADVWLSAETAARPDGPFDVMCMPCLPSVKRFSVAGVSDAELSAIIDHLLRGGA